MKTEKKNGQPGCLQASNNRWKWMAGATAATAAGVAASQAGTITIDLLNNYISYQGQTHLNPDLTGDGHPDLTIANIINTYGYRASVSLNGVQAYFRFYNSGFAFDAFMRLGDQRTFYHYYRPSGGPYTHYGAPSLMGSIPIFFKDLHINSGAPTSGSLQVTVSESEIQLDSLTYTSNTPVQRLSVTVPDQGSSLGLLAIGAGGILALRRWRAAQGYS